MRALISAEGISMVEPGGKFYRQSHKVRWPPSFGSKDPMVEESKWEAVVIGVSEASRLWAEVGGGRGPGTIMFAEVSAKGGVMGKNGVEVLGTVPI